MTLGEAHLHRFGVPLSEKSAREIAAVPGLAEKLIQAWAPPKDPPPRPRIPLRCIHLGPIVERRNCACEALHFRACAVHGRTTIKACYACPDFCDQRPLGSVRNLLFHVYPIRGNGVWQRALDQLAARLPLFNGKRVIAVAPGPGCEDAAAVQEYWAGQERVEWIVQPNDPRLREVSTWVPLWERVADCGDHCVTFYGHAKGVTRPVNPGVTCHPWARMLYEVNLDYWPLVERSLQNHPLTGAFKKVGAGFGGSRSTWHYSGTFYWVRNRDFFSRNWRKIDQVWWGTESWPGCHFPPTEAGCLFHEGTVPKLNLYDMRYLRHVEQEFEQWKRENAGSRSAIG